MEVASSEALDFNFFPFPFIMLRIMFGLFYYYGTI